MAKFVLNSALSNLRVLFFKYQNYLHINVLRVANSDKIPKFSNYIHIVKITVYLIVLSICRLH